MKKLLDLNWESTPPEMAHEIHKIVRNFTKEEDPYRKVKKESNDLVLKIYPELRLKIEKNNDPLITAIRFSIAGNIIDYGALEDFNIRRTLKEVLKEKFSIDDYKKFRQNLKDAHSLLFFTDNAGEIVLDKLLLETILNQKKLQKIRVVVKGGPIINDATIQDAFYVGLDKLPNVELLTLSNGEPGTGPTRNSQTVKEWIEEHDIVISKGQGNYEGLSEHKGLFFLLIAKCPVIASNLDVKKFDMILRYKI
jgi:uncharacterized protein with ATP-grasp and redox domains